MTAKAKGARLMLPWPPTVNHYWGRRGKRTFLSKRGRAYREAVAWAVVAAKRPHFDGACEVKVVAYPPDRRRRDLDNILKSLFDALEHARVFEDDSQVAKYSIERADVVKGGRVDVAIRERGGQ